ncbi:MAG TPA: hypothetical protein V6C65_21245 [Allocoleopsis sp.]
MSFPSFRSWCNAIKLSIIAYLGVLVFPFYAWFIIFLSGIALLSGEFQAGVQLLGIAALVLWVGFLFYLIVQLVWKFILHLLWSEPPHLLMPTQGIKANAHKFLIIIIATFPLSVIFVSHIATEATIEVTTGIEIIKSSGFTVDLIMRFYWLWLLSSAYLLDWFPATRIGMVQLAQSKPLD